LRDKFRNDVIFTLPTKETSSKIPNIENFLSSGNNYVRTIAGNLTIYYTLSSTVTQKFAMRYWIKVDNALPAQHRELSRVDNAVPTQHRELSKF
jgi:hypothetical protein